MPACWDNILIMSERKKHAVANANVSILGEPFYNAGTKKPPHHHAHRRDEGLEGVNSSSLMP
jgi:hypothetical protein